MNISKSASLYAIFFFKNTNQNIAKKGIKKALKLAVSLRSLYFFLSFFLIQTAQSAQPPEIQLANVYKEGVNVKEYLVSEKLDGVRAYWNGKMLISKRGTVIRTPKWFTKDFPQEHLEGELWISRGKFDLVSGISRQKSPSDKDWKKVKMMIFDMPKHSGTFDERLKSIKKIVTKINSQNVKMVSQFTVSNHKDLTKKLKKITKKGGEGLMLRKTKSPYKANRNNDLLKLKAYQDAEAKVLSHTAGKGKFKGMMGSILVENKEKLQFKIATGFTKKERQNPPEIGSIITYKFHGKTKTNKPKFPSFLRNKK